MIILLSAMAILAVSSPLQSASDYHFVHAPTGTVRGRVIGDSGDEGAVRAEDILFLDEAIAERNAYVRLNTTSAWIRASQNSVSNGCGIAYPPRPLLDSFVTPSSDLSTSARLMVLDDPDGMSVKNLGSNYTYNVIWYGSGATVSNILYTPGFLHVRTNVITQVMTNGTVDVWTDIYPESGYFVKNGWNVTEKTGTMSVKDFFFSDRMKDWTEDLPSNRCVQINLDAATLQTESPWIDHRKILDRYALVRRLNTSFDLMSTYTGEVNGSVPVRGRVYRYESVEQSDRTPNPPTESVTTNNFLTAASLYHSERRYYSETYETNGISTYSSKESLMRRAEGLMYLSWRMNEATDTMWLTRRRFVSAVGFADVTISNALRTAWSWSRRDPSDGTLFTNIVKYARVMVPLGSLDVVDSENSYIMSPRKTSDEIVSEAFAASGMEEMTFKDFPDLPELKTAEDNGYSQTESSVSVSRTIEVTPIFYIIYTFRPATSLDSWTDY